VVSVFNEADQSANDQDDDGDDDEDYLPESEPPKKDIDFEDEDDDGYYRVTRKEVMELVNAGVRELAKMPEVRSGVGSSAREQQQRQANLEQMQQLGSGTLQTPRHPSFPSLAPSTGSLHLPPPPPALSHQPPYHSLGSLQHPTTLAPPPESHPLPSGSGEEHKKNRLLSALVQKMFAGTGDEDLVVDDMPMNNIRKLVARQLTMSTQLVLQMLLMSDNSSEVDQQLTSSLLELSNLKDGTPPLLPSLLTCGLSGGAEDSAAEGAAGVHQALQLEHFRRPTGLHAPALRQRR
jgi:hypothetical protein